MRRLDSWRKGLFWFQGLRPNMGFVGTFIRVSVDFSSFDWRGASPPCEQSPPQLIGQPNVIRFTY